MWFILYLEYSLLLLYWANPRARTLSLCLSRKPHRLGPVVIQSLQLAVPSWSSGPQVPTCSSWGTPVSITMGPPALSIARQLYLILSEPSYIVLLVPVHYTTGPSVLCTIGLSVNRAKGSWR